MKFWPRSKKKKPRKKRRVHGSLSSSNFPLLFFLQIYGKKRAIGPPTFQRKSGFVARVISHRGVQILMGKCEWEMENFIMTHYLSTYRCRRESFSCNTSGDRGNCRRIGCFVASSSMSVLDMSWKILVVTWVAGSFTDFFRLIQLKNYKGFFFIN